MALKLTFLDGGTTVFPFGPDSQLTVDTPDGVNGVKRGSWGEVADVAVVDNTELPSGDPVVEDVDASFGDTASGTDTDLEVETWPAALDPDLDA